MRWRWAGIRSRIYVGFGSLLAIGLALTIFAILAFSSVSANVDRLDERSENINRLAQVARDFDRMRRTVEQIRLEGDADKPEEAEQRSIALLQAASLPTHAADRLQRYKELQAAVAQFALRRVTLTTTVKHMLAEKAKLFADGDALTAASEKLLDAAKSESDASIAALAGRVEAAVLLVRVANLRFLTTFDAHGPAIFQDTLARARAEIGQMGSRPLGGDNRDLLQTVSAILERYAASFAATAADLTKISDLHDKEIVPQLAVMQTSLAAAENSLRGDVVTARAAVDRTITATTAAQEIIGTLALALGALIAFWVGRSIIRPIGRMTRAMERLAAGETGIVIPSRDAADEVAAMANAVEVFRQNAIARVRLEAEQKETQARTAADRRFDIHRLADEFETAVSAVVETVSAASSELEAAASTLSTSASTTQGLSASVAAASEQASANVQSVAFASEQLAHSIGDITHRVQESSRIASEAVRQASETSAAMTEQARSAERISEVVKLINVVAEQTNLLALNATIEAARAGSAGKGFAVVAQEVKALAAQTANATEDISRQISGVQVATKESMSAIERIGATINRISDITEGLAAAIEEQRTSTRQIVDNVNQVAQGTAQVAGDITLVDQGARETGAACVKLLSSAKSLAGESSNLKAKLAQFLQTVRAA